MLLPKFATHISPFKLSHFANRGHHHFQNLRNTFTNLNLGSSVGQNSYSLPNSTATGFGSSTSGSSASSSSGASKWSAGGRPNRNQQSHNRLITHPNPAAQDGLGLRSNEDDEDHDEFFNHHLTSISLYNKPNRTISSRWHHEQNRLHPTSIYSSDSSSLQIRCKSAFVQSNRSNLVQSTPIDHLDHHSLTFSYVPRSYPPILSIHSNRTDFTICRPSRRHSIHGPSIPLLEHSAPRIRRYSSPTTIHPIKASHIPTHLVNPSDALPSSRYPYSTLSSQVQSGTVGEVSFMTNQTSSINLPDPPSLPRSNPKSIDQHWLQRAVNILSAVDHHQHSTFYQLRKLLDSYISSTATPSSDVIDLVLWGMVVNKPNFEPISNLLKCHQFLLQSTSFKPTPDTYGILLSALCKRDLSNAKELEHRKNRLANISVNQQLNQSLPNLSLAPVPTTEDVRIIGQLSVEPNFVYAAQLFNSLDQGLVSRLQPSVLEDLIRCCANVDPFGPGLAAINITTRVDLAIKAFSLLENRQALTAESYSNLINLFGCSKNLSRAKSLFETYKQGRSNSTDDPQHDAILYHQYHLQPPSSFSLLVTESPVTKMCRPEPVSESSDAHVLLSLMRVHLASGDSISALALLEESLPPTVDPSSSFKSNAAHILEIILGFIRSNDYSSASKWLRRLFNGDHASYHLDDPNRRREFMDRIVSLACEPGRSSEGLGVAYDAAMISIDQIDFQFDSKSMAALMARLRNVLNSSLVHALHQSACLHSSNDPTRADTILKIQDSLDKACSIVCYIIAKRSALLKADNGKFEAISDLQTYGMIENLAKRVIQSCQAVKNQWISSPSEALKNPARFSDDLLVRLMTHYSILPDIRDLRSASAELRHQSSYLTGLLTSYQSILQPIPTSNDQPTPPQLLEHQLRFGFNVTTPMILNNMTLVLAMQFYQLYSSAIDTDRRPISSIDDWIVLLTVGAILEIQAKEGKTIPSIRKDPQSDHQTFLEPLLIQFGRALGTSDLRLDQMNPNYDVQLLLRVIDHYDLNIPGDDHVRSFFNKLRDDHSHGQQESLARLQHYIEEGDKYLSNRFGLLRDGLSSTGEFNPSSRLSDVNPSSLCSTPVSPTAVTPASVSPVNSDEAIPAQAAPPLNVIPSLASTQIDSTAGLSNSSQPSSVPVPHPPFKSFNEQLSQLALSMFCSKDLSELDKLYDAVHQSTLEGRYLTAEASSALIETYGRNRQLNRVREMYVNAHVALASLGSGTTNDQALRSVSWTRVEDRMIIGLSYCGLIDELAIHKNRLLGSGSAPSADAYAAMIQHANETTDDASIALAYFEEAIQNRVTPNTFLCNTIISKLSKARRSTEALEVFDYMKQSNLPRNSVTFGAIINACSKTGDDHKAEELFKEMLRSKNFKPRIPPFNTMIQLFTQNVKQPDRNKVLYYYDLMSKYDLPPSDHTYNLLMQAYGFIEPCDPAAMERIFQQACKDRNVMINGSHWSTLLNVRGCVQKDLEGTLVLFDQISHHPSQLKQRRNGETGSKLPDAICYEALFNVFLAFKRADLVARYVDRMKAEGIHMTAYVVNTLMKVYSSSGNIEAARNLFESLVDPPPGHASQFNHPNSNSTHKVISPPSLSSTVPSSPSSFSNPMFTHHLNGSTISTGSTSVGKVGDPIYREPSCYETMIRIEFGLGHHNEVKSLIERLNQRGYPKPIVNRIKKIVNL